MDGKRTLKERLEQHQTLMQKLLNDPRLQESVLAAAEWMIKAFRQGKKIYFCGNGGSAADAQHLAAEFSGKFYLDREVLPAEALHYNTSYLTAVANDYSFEIVYARLMEGLGKKGDLLIGLSTSGNSPNIVKAFEVCREKGIKTIGFTGESGGKLKAFSDLLIAIPSTDTPRVQEAHITIGHILCEIVEATLFKAD
ncbi:D-sedoheptulose 7-phosphate isomerase [Parabacteroides sp. PF5-6]|uniref:D-sedoheptulose-7-phosphate isomerase n=1 Tax=Parabacteroides sp. PF5-6 TaxID=1742403 RepID=UPI0024057716|nr:D-sedoheptulose 7-phosphate isomerase [Parabacteroides sp. PF5-6]MDF9830962.1 D-sedoheptulose 7-phosphate isomerase [Parabacteroides sp. PF5-6]